MSIKTYISEIKKSKWYSRKIAVVILGMIAVIIFPESSGSISTIVGIFCGANVAQKFTATTDAAKSVVAEAKSLGEEAIKPPQK